MTTTTDRIALSATNNEMARFLGGGASARPACAPESVVKAVEVFARAMINEKFWNGWFGDISEPFFDDCVNNYLQMPSWSNKKRLHATLFSDLSNAVTYTKVPKATLEQIVNYCGYSVEWSESTVTPIKALVSMPLQAMVRATEESLARMKALLASTKPYRADEVVQIVDQLNAVYSANLAQQEAPVLPLPLDPLAEGLVLPSKD